MIWEDLGWWWLGRANLDTGNTTAARRSFHRAMEGNSRKAASAAGLGITACAFLDGEDEEAREILRSFRPFNWESHAAILEFFQVLLRYKTDPSDMRGQRVVEALMAIGEGRSLGPAGYLLAGQVYREIGRYDRAAGLYDAASEIVSGPLALRMKFEAAERYDELDIRKEAQRRYRVVAAVDRETWGPKAELRLADLALRDHQWEECIGRCRKLIGRDGIDSADVLALMGRAYEMLKQYRLAAECYAGRVPAE
jgi:tetratricopeptide (TPR) repeat protein